MSVQMNHRHYRSLRASLRTACAALLATGATACIFIDDINVPINPQVPEQPDAPRPDPHDSDEPCDTTRGEEPPRPSDESSTSTDDDSGHVPQDRPLAGDTVSGCGLWAWLGSTC